MKNKKTHCDRGHEMSGDNIHTKKGGYNICRKCAVINSINFRKRHPEVVEKLRVSRREYFKNYKKQWDYSKPNVLDEKLEWTLQRKKKRQTHFKVIGAIKKGLLERKPCVVCGNEKVDGHHPDYSKPLEVIWLCRQHHKDIHHGRLVLNKT